MRKFVFVAAALVSGSAHADWVPKFISQDNVVTVNLGGGTLSYREGRNDTSSTLFSVSADMRNIQPNLQQSLNNVMAQEAGKNGVKFLDGTLSGNLHASLQPQASGVVFMTLDGINYQARNSYSGKKFGVISFTCVNTAALNNMSITGQYGAVGGALISDQVGMTGNPTSSTDCDSNLSWILPVVGSWIINKAEGAIDSRIADGVKGAMNGVKDKLLFGRDQNWLVGLNRLVPPGKTVTLPDGRTFPIGQYINDNLQYLIANSRMDIQLGTGLDIKGVRGISEPQQENYAANLVTISINSPALAFSVQLREEARVQWKWQCQIGNPSKICPIP
ncbi:hypothetical protein [Janthinobacterium agaricidamnosum]|uniref:Uncharacterized protein n=1 Tax=Janthinobacterium agaricidamnosum NBRC 102515 = DSM 9628 TaxID=1349767 RepID=W0V990_9BURK|nr:hypothetical protein [Janthinobacterium agaricidamnosum]CDG83913.1 hypothetical protein GJA_3293 [Janthinobacterium agaricidamnosum NBRC 102515 = DSM 9628]